MPKKRTRATQLTTEFPKYAENSYAKIWMWVGVVAFSAIIVALWGWAMQIQLSSFSWQKTPENKIVKNSQENWNELFKQEEENRQLETAKLELKSALGKIMAATVVTQTPEKTLTTTISTTTNNN